MPQNKILYPQSPVIDSLTEQPNREWRSFFLNLGNLVNTIFSKTDTTATAGARTLPSNPAGFVLITINGVDYKLPYYNI